MSKLHNVAQGDNLPETFNSYVFLKQEKGREKRKDMSKLDTSEKFRGVGFQQLAKFAS